ncbi:hypothetical protein N2152v2_004782 [Parachlorella kessleri]
MSIDFFFQTYFLVKYSKSLEEGSFRNRSADFLWMLLFGGTILTLMAPFVNVQFLGSALTFMMVYVWGRRHQYVQMSFLGFFNFTAPYLPWVLLAFSVMLGGSPVMDLMGMAAGHAYYFLEDVYPRMTGRRPLRTPALVRALFAQPNIQRAAAQQQQQRHGAPEQAQPWAAPAAGAGGNAAAAGANAGAAAAGGGAPREGGGAGGEPAAAEPVPAQ